VSAPLAGRYARRWTALGGIVGAVLYAVVNVAYAGATTGVWVRWWVLSGLVWANCMAMGVVVGRALDLLAWNRDRERWELRDDGQA
jgi:hypothetical protein